MLRVLADGQVLGDATGGQPPAVVCLPGWGRTHKDFAGVVAGLDALCLDPPGFGDTPPPSEAWGAEGYAEVVADAILEAVGEGGHPPVVVGHSFGGRIAVALAATRPELVRSLVLVGVPLVRLSAPPAPPASYRLARWLNRRGILSDEAMETRRRKSGSSEYRSVTGVMRDIHVRAVNETYEMLLPKVEHRVEMVWAENDTTTPVGITAAAVRLLPDATVTTVPTGGHLLPVTSPDVVRAAVDRALSRSGR